MLDLSLEIVRSAECDCHQDLTRVDSQACRAHGLIAAWQGKRHEDRYTQIWILLWQNLASSHAFFTSPAYRQFHDVIQPALNGRSIHWQQHALVGTSDLDTLDRLTAMIKAPVIEVALTKVIEGRVSGYYDVFRSTIGPILDGEDGCAGWWVGPQLENPQHQILLENWRSVDVCPPTLMCTHAFHNSNSVFHIARNWPIRRWATFKLCRRTMMSLRKDQHFKNVSWLFPTIMGNM